MELCSMIFLQKHGLPANYFGKKQFPGFYWTSQIFSKPLISNHDKIYSFFSSEHASEKRFKDLRRVAQADVGGEFHRPRHFVDSISRRSQSSAPPLQADAKETDGD